MGEDEDEGGLGGDAGEGVREDAADGDGRPWDDPRLRVASHLGPERAN